MQEAIKVSVILSFIHLEIHNVHEWMNLDYTNVQLSCGIKVLTSRYKRTQCMPVESPMSPSFVHQGQHDHTFLKVMCSHVKQQERNEWSSVAVEVSFHWSLSVYFLFSNM